VSAFEKLLTEMRIEVYRKHFNMYYTYGDLEAAGNITPAYPTLSILGVPHAIREEALDILVKEYIAIRKYHIGPIYRHYTWM
jgi:hypothetical protein